MATLYTGSEKISQDCRIGTREEWEATLSDCWKDWWNGSDEQENGVNIEEFSSMTLDSELSEADEDEVNDSDYKRLDLIENFEIDTDSGITVGYKGDTYYLQLPDCADSQHTDSEGNDIDEDVLSLLKIQVYSQLKEPALSFASGFKNLVYEEISVETEHDDDEGNSVYSTQQVYVVVDADEHGSVEILQKNRCSDYYNIVMYEKSERFYFTKKGTNQVFECIKKLTNI